MIKCYNYGLAKTKSTGAEVNPFKYGGKELSTELSTPFYDFEARVQLPTLGLFGRPDPKAGDFQWLNTYSYCGADPVNNTDPTGMTINMNPLKLWDKQSGQSTADAVIKDLTKQTGLILSFDDDGRIQYQKDKDGKPIVSTTKDKDGKIIEAGSKTARKLLIKGINSKNEVTVFYASSSYANNDQIGLSFAQINEFIKGAVGVDGNTLGFGMVFLHELLHTSIGGNLLDDQEVVYGTGPVVDKMNKIRSELNKQGFNYGQRYNYNGIVLKDGSIITPFNSSALSNLKNNSPMGKNNKYIKTLKDEKF